MLTQKSQWSSCCSIKDLYVCVYNCFKSYSRASGNNLNYLGNTEVSPQAIKSKYSPKW